MGMATGGARSKAEINMTPMIDVLLVLIIIFMVITPLTPAGLRTLVPQPPDAAEHESSTDIVVTVERDGSARLNAERIELLALHEHLSRIYQVRGDAVIFVRGDKRLEFQQIAAVIDIAKGAGLQRVALMTD
jgi:biopolymer transport protein TolR